MLSELSIAQPLSSYAVKLGGPNFTIDSQLPNPILCTSSYGGTQWGFQDGFGTNTFFPMTASSCGIGCRVSSSPSSISISPGGSDGNVQNFNYRSRPFNMSSCSVSFGAINNVSSFSVTTYSDLTLSGTPFPVYLCSTAGTLNLSNYISISSALTSSVIYQLDGTTIGSTLTASSVSPGPHTLTALYPFANGTTTVTIRNFTAGTALSGVSNPSDQSICSSGSVSFTTSGSGTGVTFQWQESTNGGGSWNDLSNVAVYSGANTNTLTLTNPGLSYNNYLYRCRINDAGNCNPTTTSSAKLSFFGQVGVNSSPANQTGCINGTVSLSASGQPRNGSIQYQWQTLVGSTWTNLNNQAYAEGTVSGANAATLTISSLQLSASGKQYRAVMQDNCGAVNATNTASATITVLPPVSITVNPTDKSICGSAGTTFSVSATGNAGLSYQWQVSSDNGTSYFNINNDGNYTNATTATLNIANSIAFNNFLYRCIVTDACGPTQATSIGARLTIITSPTITSQPTPATLCEGSTTSFSVSATGSSLTYQWQRNGSNIPGANSASYSIANSIPANSGNYTVIVSNACLSTTSNIAALTVNPQTGIGTQPVNSAVCPGGNVSFTTTAAGTGPFSYTWEKNTGASWFTVGSNSPSLSITNAGGTDAAQYRVTIQGSCGANVTSNTVALTINTIPSMPTVADVARCGTGSISTTASSPAPSPVFNWYNNAGDVTPVFTGATRTLSSIAVTTTQFVSVSSGTPACESVRKPVTFTVNAIQNVPLGNALSLCAGQSAYNLENDIADAVAKGNDFTWAAGPNIISSKIFDPVTAGLGTYTVSYTPPAAAQATPYCYITTTRTITVTTGAVAITFNDPLISGGNTVNTCVGNAPIIISNFPSVAGGTWAPIFGSGISSSGSTTIFTPDASNFTATSPNVFRYTVTSGGCSGSRDLNIFVKDNQAPPIVSGLPALVCPSTNLNLSASVSVTGTYTYDWFKSGQQNPFTSGAALSYPVTGNEDIFVRSVNSFNCRSSATQVSIKTPFGAGSITASKNNVTFGEVVKFSYSVNNSGNTYDWDFGDGGKSREFAPAYYFYKVGQYSVKLKVTSTIGCTQNSQYDFITVTGTPISVITALDDVLIPSVVSAYPNPVEDELTVEAPFPVLAFTVGDMNGSKITTQTGNGERKLKVETASLSPGMYLLQLRTSENKVYTLKFIKQ